MFLNDPRAAAQIVENWLSSMRPMAMPNLSPIYGDGFQPYDLLAGSRNVGGTRSSGPLRPANPREGIALYPVDSGSAGLPVLSSMTFNSFPTAPSQGGGGEGGSTPGGETTLLCVGTLALEDEPSGGAFCGTGESQSDVLDFTEFVSGEPLKYSTNVRFDLSGSTPKLVHDEIDKLMIRLRRTTVGTRSDLVMEVYGHVDKDQTISELAPC